jgi:hypothetical protein
MYGLLASTNGRTCANHAICGQGVVVGTMVIFQRSPDVLADGTIYDSQDDSKKHLKHLQL